MSLTLPGTGTGELPPEFVGSSPSPRPRAPNVSHMPGQPDHPVFSDQPDLHPSWAFNGCCCRDQ